MKETLGSFKARNKEEAGRMLGVVEKEIADITSKLNGKDLIPLLLHLEDAVNNLEIACQKRIIVDKEFQGKEELLLALNIFVAEWFQIINYCIIEISENGTLIPPKIAKLPKFMFGVHFQQDLDDQLLALHKKGELDDNDVIYRKPRLFLNRIPGWFFIAVRGEGGDYLKKCITAVLDLRDLFYKKGLLEAMIYVSPNGTQVEFDDNTGLRKITLPKSVTAESVYEQQGLTPRLLETYTSVFDWNSYFREIAIKSLEISELGKGEQNLKNLKKEDDEIYKAYSSMQNFPETFSQFYGMELKQFFYIISEIIYLCYDNDHTLGWWSYPDLLREKRLTRKFSPKLIRNAVQLLSTVSRHKKRYDGFVVLDSDILTNFKRLYTARMILLEKCFSEAFDNDLKGKTFEQACRKLLSDNGWATLPKRVEILEPMIPPEVSYSLWGKQKQRTDIDVVSSQGNCVLTIECKEIKSSKLKLRQKKQFKKYLIEHFFKSKWVLNNLKKFGSYVGNNLYRSLSIDEKRLVYLFPLLVTNILVDIEGISETPLITYVELSNIVSSKELHIESEGKTSGVLELAVNGRKIGLPWFSRMP